MSKNVYKVDCVINTCRFLNGVLWALMEEQNASPTSKDYLMGKMFDCISVLESLKSDMLEVSADV